MFNFKYLKQKLAKKYSPVDNIATGTVADLPVNMTAQTTTAPDPYWKRLMSRLKRSRQKQRTGEFEITDIEGSWHQSPLHNNTQTLKDKEAKSPTLLSSKLEKDEDKPKRSFMSKMCPRPW